jgi:hypothetical protein
VEDYCVRLVPGISATAAVESLGQLRVFPQPATQYITLALSGEKLGGKLALAAWNTAGQAVEVITSDQDDNTIQMDISRWQSGVYLIRGTLQGQMFWQRVVKI